MSKEDDATLVQDLRKARIEMTLAYDATIEGFARALDMREGETPGHTRRVTEMTVAMATGLGIAEADLLHIKRGALLHDIGKMGIPESILQKPDSLSPEEWVIMHLHPQYAYDLLSPIIYLYPALDIPYCHHEKWDGSGYPRGLNGELIPFAARIFAVADVWDALTSKKPYREAWPETKVKEYIQTQSGVHFDPAVVKVFMNTEYKKRLTSPIVK